MKSPLSNSYWVVAGRLLAGEHPYGMDEADASNRLRSLRAAGINYFIDLTQREEMPEYRHLLPAETKYLRSPIADVEVPSEVVQMQQIQGSAASAPLRWGPRRPRSGFADTWSPQAADAGIQASLPAGSDR